MLIAHLVPGYFNAIRSQRHWDKNWTPTQQRILWSVAFAGTFIPDTDVIFNIVFRGFANHSTLLTHSLFPVLIFIFTWGICKYVLHKHYLSTLFSLLAVSWLSHLLLDALVHKTPLFYPLSSAMIGYAPTRVYKGGLWYYLTDPIFLLEPFLISVGVGHWAYRRIADTNSQRIFIALLAGINLILATVFMLLLPYMQNLVQNI